MSKDMYEQFIDKQLPTDIQEQIESSALIHSNYGEDMPKYWFSAGFFTAKKIKKIKEERGEDAD